MDWLSILIIAVGLAMDAFAVSVSSGVVIKRMHVRHALLIAGFFGFFQGLMPFVGWHVGHMAGPFVAAVEHWVVFALLVAIGLKMIWEAVKLEEVERSFDPLNLYVLFLLSLATSLDALAVGVSLSLLDVAIARPVVLIGAVTFVMSFAGAYVGKVFGHLLERKMEIVGGLVLIAVGVKVLLMHYLA